MFVGCKKPPPTPVQLDTALETHFLLIQEGKTGSARVRLRQYMAKHGDTSEPLFLMGLSYHHDKLYSKAIEWLEKAVSVENPGSVFYDPTWHFLGWSYFYVGNAKSSREAFHQFLNLHPNEGDTLFALGLLASEEGDSAESQQLLLRAIAAPNTNVSIQAKARARLADLYAEEGNWQDAIRLYSEAVKENPDLYEAWYRMAQALHRTGQFEDATDAMMQFERARLRVRPAIGNPTRFPE